MSSLSSESHKYEGTASLSPDCSKKEDFTSLRAVEIVKIVGLITCERRVIGQRARLLILVECQWDIALIKCTWKRKRYRSRFRKKKRNEKHTDENKVRKKVRTINQIEHMDDYADETKRAPTLEPCSVLCNNECVFTA